MREVLFMSTVAAPQQVTVRIDGRDVWVVAWDETGREQLMAWCATRLTYAEAVLAQWVDVE